MDQIIEIKDVGGNIVRVYLFSTLNQIAAHMSTTMEPGDSLGVVNGNVQIEITKND